MLHRQEQPDVEWYKEVNGIAWYPGIALTLQLSDTVDVMDTVLAPEGFVLVEFWDPGTLALMEWIPTIGEVIITPGNPFVLEWFVPPGLPEPATLFKRFHVEPCTWLQTVLWEELWIGGVLYGERPVVINKVPPLLWIDAEYEAEVWAGMPAEFALVYGNGGGNENDVMVRNEFPPEALFLGSDPPADRQGADGSWAEWDVPWLGMDEVGRITVTVGIDPTLPPSTTIDIWDYIYDHVQMEQDAVQITLHVREVEWNKEVNGIAWYPGLTVTVETSDTLEVVDTVMTLQDFVLVEFWDSEALDLVDYQIEPPGTSVVVTDTPGMLEWIVPAGEPLVVTLTKWFHVEPCTWTETLLWEELWLAGAEYEQRPVTVTKLLPDLWIDAEYEAEVLPGGEVTFTLLYGNDGGYENGVVVRNDFPDEAPFVSSIPPADREAADGSWAEWDVGDLAMGAESHITITIAVSEGLVAPGTFEVWDTIANHVGEVMDVVTLTFTLKSSGFQIYLPVVLRNF